MKTPGFIIIGPPKCGTTSLADTLEKHTQLSRSTREEIHFFNVEKRYNLGFDFYLSHFDTTSNETVLFEKTPDYIWSEIAMKRIRQDLPNVKLICILREPVSRLVSNYIHFRAINRIKTDPTVGDRFKQEQPIKAAKVFRDNRWLGETETLDNVVNQHKLNPLFKPNYFLAGKYIKHLKFIKSIFLPDRLHVIIFNDLISNPSQEIAQVLKFVGVDYQPLEFRNENTSAMWKLYYDASSEVTPYALSYIKEYYKDFNARLEKYLNRELQWA